MIAGRRSTLVQRAVNSRAVHREAGFTLLEVLLTLVVLGLVMVPLLAWMVVALQRSNDNSVANDTRTFTELSRFVDRDVASSLSVQVWKPAIGTTPALAPGDPCPTPTPLIDEPSSRVWMMVQDENNRAVVYLTDTPPVAAGETAVTRLIRKVCDGTTPSPQVLAENLDTVDLGNGTTVPVSVACEARTGILESCGVVTLTAQAQRGSPISLRSERRVSAARDATLLPVADVRCVPSCTGTRNADNQYTVTLDGTYSSSPAGTPLVAWNFGGAAVAPQTELRTDPLTFTCTNSSSEWNTEIRGCIFTATLTLTDPRGQISSRQQQIVVLNSSPVVSFNPQGVSAFRTDPICFDAFSTSDADDPTGAGLTFNWTFDDPNPTAVQSASGRGVPVTDCATESTAPGVVSHVYSRTTGSTPRNATLTVTDAEGDVQTFSIPISIGNKPPVPVITSTVNSLDGIPSGTIEWDGSQSYDPDGNATNTGPAPVSLYEWVLTDANGVLYKQDSLQVAGTKAILPNPGIDRAGVYTVALTVTDLSDSTLKATTTRIINVNTRPRAAITEVTPTGGVITPDAPVSQPSITLNGGPAGTATGSYDPDPTGSISNYKWEFWTNTTTTRPNQACSATVAPPCFIDGGASPTVTFGPSQANRVPYGSYRVKLVVKDDSNVENECAPGTPYNSTCIDDISSASSQRWWTNVKINRPPTVTLATPTPSAAGAQGTEVRRRTAITLGTSAATDPDGSIATYLWSFTRTGGGTVPVKDAATGGAPTLTTASTSVRFDEPDVDYQVNATLRVTDNDGGVTLSTTSFWVRNNTPNAGITVVNSQTESLFGVPNYNTWTTPNPTTSPAVFRFDAYSSTDVDGSIASRYWRIYNLNTTTNVRTQVAEFSDNNSGGTTCSINTGFPGVPNLLQDCKVFEYTFRAYGSYVVDVEVRDNNGAISRTDVTVKVNRPPTLSVSVLPGEVANSQSTSQSFNFAPSVVLGDGGAITEYRFDWGDGVNGNPSTNTYTAAGSRAHNYNTATLNSNGTCATNTGVCGRWNVTITVVDSERGTATITKTIRINRTPVPVLIDPATGLPDADPFAAPTPTKRINCPPLSSDSSFGVCELPAFDASPSYDPDSSAPLTEYRWYDGNYVPATPATNLARASASPILSTSPPVTSNVGYSLTSGKLFQLVVVDADNARSAATDFRVVANRAPTKVEISAPTLPVAGNASVQRNVPTTWTATSVDDATAGAGNATYTLRFEDSTGAPLTFLDSTGTAVTSVSGQAPIGTAWSTQVTHTQEYTNARAILTATDSDGLSASNCSTATCGATLQNYRFNVGNASPVAVITPVIPADAGNPIVCTYTTAVPGACFFRVSNVNSFDPDGATAPGIAAYSWTVAPLAGGTATSCTTGRINSSVLGEHVCTLPNVSASSYGTYRVTLQVWDVPIAGVERSGTTTWDVKVNRAPTATFTATPSGVAGLSTPITFNAAGSSDADGGIASYTWDFGDGSPPRVVLNSAGTSTSYTYSSYPASGQTYTVTLRVTDINGGQTQTTRTVTVNRPPSVELNVSRNGVPCTAEPCILNKPAPYTVNLNNTGSTDLDGTVVGYVWNVGGPYAGAQPSGGGGNVTFTQPGTYPATLTATDNTPAPATGSTTVTRTIRVNAVPTATIGGDATLNIGRGAPFTLQALDVNDPDGDAITNYSWEFLDENGTRIGAVDNQSAASYQRTFTSVVPASGSGTGTVRLTLTDAAGGVSDVITKPFVVSNQAPIVNVATTPSPAIITPTNPGGPTTVAFSSAGTSDPDGGTLGYTWTFRRQSDNSVALTVPGPASLAVGPSTSPALPVGRYNATLTVTDGQGGSTTSSVIPVAINAAPDVQAASTPAVVNESDTPQVTLNSTGTTDSDGTIASYAWSVSGPSGFTASGSAPTLGPLTLGSFGDYAVTLTVTDNEGGIGTKSFTVRRNRLPIAGATISFTGGTCTIPGTGLCVINTPYSFTVNGSTSTDDKSIIRYDWRVFRAADLAADPNATPVLARLNGAVSENFTLTDGGQYVVRLTVTDSDGASSVASPSTASRELLANRAPVPSISGASPLSVGRNEDFTYQATFTDADNDAAQTYRWVFKDENGVAIGLPDTVVDPTFTKAINRLVPGLGGSGTGTIELTVTDVNGGSATTTKSFVLVNQRPVAALSPDGTATVPLVGAPGLEVPFVTASFDPDGTLLSQTLEICPDPDGSAGCRVEPIATGGSVVTFPNYGTYTATLTVVDDSGDATSNTATDSVTIKINRPPTAGIRNASPTVPFTVPVNVAINLNGSAPTYSSDTDGTITSYLWVFSDGFSAVDTPTVSHTFTAPGNYWVDLTVFDNDGESNTVRANITVTETTVTP